MSTRQSRKVTTTTTSYSSSSGGGVVGASSSAGEAASGSASFSASSSSSRRSGSGVGARPPSPARLTRIQEKEELQNLNDRLAAYIDRVRSLEIENSRLSLAVRSTEETVRREVSGVKTLYDSELAELRKLLDETAKEKARLQIEANKYKTDYEDLLTRYNKRDREAAALERRVQVLERQLSEVEGQKFEKENASLRTELSRVETQLVAAKKQLEEETLQRVDLENRVKTLKEDIHFKSQVYEQELEESRVRTTTQIEEVDGRIEQEYEARLQDALREIRSQHDYDIQSVKEELETLYESKINDLRAQAERAGSSTSSAWEELMASRRSVDDLNAEMARLRSENAGYELRLKDLEKQVSMERSEYRAILSRKDDEISILRKQIEDYEAEYAALLEIKIKLDREIEAYRKLLESEETRLNLSATSEKSIITTSSSSVGGGKKRRRVDIGEAVEEYTQRSRSSGYSRSASATGGIEIEDVDVDGKFIKLRNKTDKDIHLHHWQLKHVAGDNETVHKFLKNVLKGGQTVTIWSSDSDTTHNPPHDLVMKNKRWFVSSEMTTTLLNDDDEELATCTMSRNLRSVSQFSQRRSGRLGDLGSGQQLKEKDNCSIM